MRFGIAAYEWLPVSVQDAMNQITQQYNMVFSSVYYIAGDTGPATGWLVWYLGTSTRPNYGFLASRDGTWIGPLRPWSTPEEAARTYR